MMNQLLGPGYNAFTGLGDNDEWRKNILQVLEGPDCPMKLGLFAHNKHDQLEIDADVMVDFGYVDLSIPTQAVLSETFPKHCKIVKPANAVKKIKMEWRGHHPPSLNFESAFLLPERQCNLFHVEMPEKEKHPGFIEVLILFFHSLTPVNLSFSLLIPL